MWNTGVLIGLAIQASEPTCYLIPLAIYPLRIYPTRIDAPEPSGAWHARCRFSGSVEKPLAREAIGANVEIEQEPRVTRPHGSLHGSARPLRDRTRVMPIAFLADRSEFLPRLAVWLHGEWGDLRPDDSLERRTEWLEARMNRDRIPVCLVAHEGSTPLGTASLVVEDVPGRPDLTPCLASVFVALEHRERGVGTELVSAVEVLASGLGFETLHLFTFDRDPYYGRRGWSVLERTECYGRAAVIMKKALGPRTRTEGVRITCAALPPGLPEAASRFPGR
jgi:GNAT superfamily N-acetyltransferase